jgi:hypothetical protein
MTDFVKFEYSQTVKLFEGRSYDEDFLPDNLIQAIGWLQSKLDSVPDEFKGSVTIEMESDSDCGPVALTLAYQRPPTDDEVAARHAEYRKRTERDIALAKERLAREEQRLARLGGAV